MLNRRSFLVAGATVVLGTAPAQAGFLDAITGHIEDITDRINHEDSYAQGSTILSGSFRDDDIGRDLIHWANGSASLIRSAKSDYIQLGDDFEAGPAPDLYIYTSINKVVDEKTFRMAQTTEIGKLQSGSGAQYYAVSQLFSQQEHKEVIIWCKRFGAFIAAATLR